MSTAIHEFSSPLPLVTADGEKCLAYLLMDYGPEHDSLFLVGMRDSRELWWLPNSRLRLDDNISLGRPPRDHPPA